MIIEGHHIPPINASALQRHNDRGEHQHNDSGKQICVHKNVDDLLRASADQIPPVVGFDPHDECPEQIEEPEEHPGQAEGRDSQSALEAN